MNLASRLLFIAVFSNCLLSNAQVGETSVRKSRPSKDEIIWQYVQDDTTRALAVLFTAKRDKYNRHIKRATIGLIFSAVTYGTGGIILIYAKDPINTLGVIPLVIGGIGIVLFAGYDIFFLIKKHPYRIKKYLELIEAYKMGIALPAYYTKQF